VVDVSKTIDRTLAVVSRGSKEGTDHESKEKDCSDHPEAPTVIALESEWADCKGKDEKAISEGENRP
jgi:hypothetical protein